MTGIEIALIMGLVTLVGIGTGSVVTGIVTGRTKVSKEVCDQHMEAFEKLSDEKYENIEKILERIEKKVDKRNGIS